MTNNSSNESLEGVLTQEQDALLDLYLNNLDNFFENQKNAEKIQVEIETLHLKKILTE
ncbi:hypothetical protein [Rufibacter aurantiacus]|uniref:hypothetical protein n=1 Tax=Rufibacter aurantiacus TaxID=2817374 RepID=UPI001B31641D|nr:hypothetical protein [Rufibacter aurantiacus]